MNALQSYSSDDESGNESPMHKNSNMSKPDDPFTNYDDVGMDISEESGAEDDANDRQQQKPQQQHHNKKRDSKSHKLASPEEESHKDHTDKPRSSLQERLLGLASGERRSSQEEKSGSGKDRRDRSRSRSRDKHSTHSGGRSRDEKSVHDRRKRDDERRGRRSRSKSRERRRSRSRERRRSRSRSRDRERHRRDRSRSRDRKRPMDIRKVMSPQALGSARVGVGKRPVSEAQQKLAALKASNPDLTTAELLRRSMEAQITEVEKQTGIALPSYYNPAAMNPVKFAEQERKKKLLWGNKSKSPETPTASIESSSGSSGHEVVSGSNSKQSMPGSGNISLWANTKFSGDKDGKMAEKFKRLMGVKNSDGPGGGGIGGGSIGGGSIGGGSIGGGGVGGGGGSKGLYGSLVAASSVKAKPVDPLQEQEVMFNSMERQYEMARLATHTQRGFGLGFSSQSFVPK